MDILKNINHRLTFIESEANYGGEEEIKKVLRESPIQLPEDYIDFLRQIPGEDSFGLSFQVDNSRKEIWIWSAGFALEKRDEFYAPFLEDFFRNAWLIGCDVGDLIYCYGKGKEGFGIYRTEDSSLCLDDMAEKIADSLTDFLVNGVGIDVSITL